MAAADRDNAVITRIVDHWGTGSTVVDASGFALTSPQPLINNTLEPQSKTPRHTDEHDVPTQTGAAPLLVASSHEQASLAEDA